MDETAPNNPQFPQGGNMSAERPQPLEGVTPFEERQVGRAREIAERALAEGAKFSGGAEDEEEAERLVREEYEEIARREALGRERYRRVERVNGDEIDYYSPEQMGLLAVRKIESLLSRLQEREEVPGNFKWESEREAEEREKVIQALEEIVSFSPEERVRRGYPAITITNLVNMGVVELRPYVRIERLLGERRRLKEETFLEERDEKRLGGIETELDKVITGNGQTVPEGPQDRESAIATLERDLIEEREAAIRKLFPERVEKLRQLHEFFSGFDAIYNFNANVQRVLAVSASDYHNIFIHVFGAKSRFETKPPRGRHYEGLLNAPEFLPGTPPFKDLLELSFRELKDILDSPDNIFNGDPDATKRNDVLERIKTKLIKNSYDEGSLDPNNILHNALAKAAARLALLLAVHWDMHNTFSLKLNAAKRRASVEVTYSDMSKMFYPAVRALSEARDYRAMFGNYPYSGVMYRLTDNFLAVASPTLNGSNGEKTRISLWDLVFKHGYRLRDLPWLGQKLDLKPEAAITPIQRAPRESLRASVKFKGKDVKWTEMTDAREDALAIPYYLHTFYSGSFFERITGTDFIKEMEEMGKGSFWEDLNKPFDTGFKIFLGSFGFNEETVYKLMVMAKINLVAGVIAAVEEKQRISEHEYKGNVLSKLDSRVVYSAIFSTEFLPKQIGTVELGEDDERATFGLNINVNDLLKKLAKQGRGIIPGDNIISGMFTPAEIEEIDRKELYKPFLISPSRKNSPLHILNVLDAAINTPKTRA